MNLVVANQGKIYEVASKTRGPINEDIVIRKWGKMDTGRPVYFGLVAASDLAALFEKHQDSLFIPNIRAFKGDTDVNNVIVESLLSEPSAFCYLNNGITVISTEVNRKPLGGASNESGFFECKGLAIVNGAQTAGACNKAYRLDPEKSSAAYVMIRLIETGKSDIALTDAITRATNTQNKIERKDFVALDSYQRQLKEELDILGIQYTFKSGEVLVASETSFDLSDLTQALIADTGDMALISLAKREIGRVWDDISKPPYKTLFNPSHTAYYMKHCLLLFAKIQEVIKPCAGDDRRKIQYTVHGNVFFAAECLKHIDKTNFKSDKFNLSAAYEKITCIAPQIFEKAFVICEHDYPGSYLAHLFRNREKIAQISDLITK